MSTLVDKLSAGEHPVELRLRETDRPDNVRATISSGYVHVKFTDTQGGTEIGFPVDRERSRIEDGQDEIRLVGQLTLDYVPVRCIASIHQATGRGKGRLERVQAK